MPTAAPLLVAIEDELDTGEAPESLHPVSDDPINPEMIEQKIARRALIKTSPFITCCMPLPSNILLGIGAYKRLKDATICAG